MTKIEKRHQKILELLSLTPLTTIAELSEKLAVSNETIRKDLKILSEENVIIQTHGGVALRKEKNVSHPFDYRMQINSESKERVGRTAISLIEKNDVILLENSTTSLALARELCKNQELMETLVIATTSFKIAAQIDEAFSKGEPTCRLFFIGGWMNFQQHGTFGLHVLETLKSIHFTKAFISGAALDEKLRLSGYDDDDVSFQKYAIEYANETILMIEKGKFPKSAMLNVADIAEVDHIVTDIEFSAAAKSKLREAKVKILQAD